MSMTVAGTAPAGMVALRDAPDAGVDHGVDAMGFAAVLRVAVADDSWSAALSPTADAAAQAGTSSELQVDPAASATLIDDEPAADPSKPVADLAPTPSVAPRPRAGATSFAIERPLGLRIDDGALEIGAAIATLLISDSAQTGPVALVAPPPPVAPTLGTALPAADPATEYGPSATAEPIAARPSGESQKSVAPQNLLTPLGERPRLESEFPEHASQEVPGPAGPVRIRGAALPSALPFEAGTRSAVVVPAQSPDVRAVSSLDPTRVVLTSSHEPGIAKVSVGDPALPAGSGKHRSDAGAPTAADLLATVSAVRTSAMRRVSSTLDPLTAQIFPAGPLAAKAPQSAALRRTILSASIEPPAASATPLTTTLTTAIAAGGVADVVVPRVVADPAGAPATPVREVNGAVQVETARLGLVHIAIEAGAQRAGVHFGVETGAAAALLGTQQGRLETTLAAAGTRLDALSVDVRGGGSEARHHADPSSVDIAPRRPAARAVPILPVRAPRADRYA